MLQHIDTYCTSVRLDGETYTAILKPEYAIDGERVIKADAKSAYAGKWVTINGARVLIGKNGVVLGGAGGNFNGMNFSDGVRKLHRARGVVNASNKFENLKKELRSVKEKAEHHKKQVEFWGKVLKVREQDFGKGSSMVNNAKKALKEEQKAHLASSKNAALIESKMNAIKKKYPNVENVKKQRQASKERRELRRWAKANGYDPNTNPGILSNLRHRATEYRRGANGGVWTGDRQDAKPVNGKWVTINGAKVLIKGGKFVNGPFAGQSVGVGAKYFSANAGKVPEKTRAVLASACSDVDKNGTSSVWMDNYKIDLKKVKDFPKADKVVVTAHNIVQHAGNNKSTITKHPINELGDRLIELHDLVKPKEIVVHSNDR